MVVVEAEAIVVVIADLVLVGTDVVYSSSSSKSGSSSVTNQSEWDQMSFVGVRLCRRVLQPTQACHSIHTKRHSAANFAPTEIEMCTHQSEGSLMTKI